MRGRDGGERASAVRGTMRVTDPRTLHELQLELECKGIADGDRLVRVAGEEPDDLELAQATRLADGEHRLLVRHDVHPRVLARLRSVDPATAFERPEVVVAAVGDPGLRWTRGRSHVFPPGLARPDDVVVRSEPGFRRPGFFVLRDGRAVSRCVSSRENDRAGEAWVETDPEFRGRGLASRVVAAWACSLAGGGKIAFYSHLDANRASAAVAARLGLTCWIRFVSFEPD